MLFSMLSLGVTVYLANRFGVPKSRRIHWSEILDDTRTDP